MDASQAFAFHFSPYITGSNTTYSFIFFSIRDETGFAIPFDDVAPGATTSIILPANTLKPGHLFEYDLIYANLDLLSNPGDAVYGPQFQLDIGTEGTFTTAATPEPGSAAMLAIAGLAGLFLLRRRAKTAA